MIEMEAVRNLIERAKSTASSGHPHLDRRWKEEGEDGRNKHYRRTYYRFCQSLAALSKPRLVVELGIDEGDCCGHWASGNKATQVVGVDVHKDSEAPAIKCREMAKQFPNFIYMRGWTWDKKEEVKKFGPIDILYIDSWHEYDYFARDWNDYAPLLAEESILIVDDLQNPGVLKGFKAIPGRDRHVDATMNPAVPFGITLMPDRKCVLPFKRQDFMP